MLDGSNAGMDGDGVSFQVISENYARERKVLFSKNLNPSDNIVDRGLFTIKILVVYDINTLISGINSSLSNSTAYDQSHWTVIYFN